jgi:hypothetical protein
MLLSVKSILTILIMIGIFISLLTIGAAIYQALETDITYRDSLFLMVMSSTTVGITNQKEPKTSGGIWFLMIYSLLLVSYFLGSFFVLFSLT